ncbi:PH domain-containing protein [Solibacillus sp. FSL K6-1523]
MSIDRIEITFDPDMQVTLVSPKDKELFVKKLLEINPTIKLLP